jgi:hypothetical protein
MSEPDYTKMGNGELLDALGDDAYKWATAFCQIKKKMGWSPKDIDHSLMIAWFANAIETACRVRHLPRLQRHERRNTHLCTGH